MLMYSIVRRSANGHQTTLEVIEIHFKHHRTELQEGSSYRAICYFSFLQTLKISKVYLKEWEYPKYRICTKINSTFVQYSVVWISELVVEYQKGLNFGEPMAGLQQQL
jgi:hypothetical protein